MGWIVGILPAGLLVLGTVGLIAPFASQQVRLLALGAAARDVGAPWLLRGYGLLARSMLAPTKKAELVRRVRPAVADPHRSPGHQGGRDPPDRAGPARRSAGQAGRHGHDPGRGGPEHRRQPGAARALLVEARDASVKALAEVRDLVRGIHPPVLADRGLADAIRALALDSPMRIHVASDADGRPPAPVESAAYFAVGELLANVSKHAEARQTWIDVRHADGMVQISVTDNGHGGADQARGSGLRGIERRLAPFDGVLAVSSPPGGPTAITMEIHARGHRRRPLPAKGQPDAHASGPWPGDRRRRRRRADLLAAVTSEKPDVAIVDVRRRHVHRRRHPGRAGGAAEVPGLPVLVLSSTSSGCSPASCWPAAAGASGTCSRTGCSTAPSSWTPSAGSRPAAPRWTRR